MSLSLDEHERLTNYCRAMGQELGIDLIGDYFDKKEQDDFQKDRLEFEEEMSLGGRRYEER